MKLQKFEIVIKKTNYYQINAYNLINAYHVINAYQDLRW